MNDELSISEIEMNTLQTHMGKLIKSLGPLFEFAHNDLALCDDRFALSSIRIIPLEDYYDITIDFKVSRNGL